MLDPMHAFGWYAIATSHGLRVGEVRPVRYFGQELVLFRTASGEAHVLDAHCPHLGAHLGVGGKVKGEQLLCPFHGWGFTGDGACAHVPFAQKVPPKARTRGWPVSERNGYIFMWFHPRQDAPSYAIDDFFAARGGPSAWRCVAEFFYRIKTQPSEIMENGVDRAHFPLVHGYAAPPKTEVIIDGHSFKILSQGTNHVLGRMREVDIALEHTGPGFTRSRVDAGVAKLELLLSTVPVDAHTVEQRFLIWVEKTLNPLPWLLGALVIAPHARRDFERDIPIWENKRHLVQPVLSDTDGPIMKFRKWYRQYLVEAPSEA